MTTNVENMKLLINLYKGMDWSYMMSDDSSVNRRGRAAKAQLILLMKTVGLDGDAVYAKSWSPSDNRHEYRKARIAVWEALVAHCGYAGENVDFKIENNKYVLVFPASEEEVVEDVNVLTTADGEINLDELPEAWRSRVGAVEALRLACGAAAWPTKVYRALRVYGTEGRRLVTFSDKGLGMFTPRARKNFLSNVASAMQEKGLNTDLRGARKLYVISKKN